MIARVLLVTSAGLLLVGVLLMAYFVLSGTTVDQEGFLVEEFWAWGLGTALVLVSLIGYALWGAARLAFLLRSR